MRHAVHQTAQTFVRIWRRSLAEQSRSARLKRCQVHSWNWELMVVFKIKDTSDVVRACRTRPIRLILSCYSDFFFSVKMCEKLFIHTSLPQEQLRSEAFILENCPGTRVFYMVAPFTEVCAPGESPASRPPAGVCLRKAVCTQRRVTYRADVMYLHHVGGLFLTLSLAPAVSVSTLNACF